MQTTGSNMKKDTVLPPTRVTSEEKEAFTKVSAAEKKTLSEWLRELANDRVSRYRQDPQSEERPESSEQG